MPNSSLKSGWDLLMILLLIYVATFQIWTMAFLPDTVDWISAIKYFVDLCIDILFFVDIAINFITAYERGATDLTIETRFKFIAINYFAGFFLIDFVSALPLQ